VAVSVTALTQARFARRKTAQQRNTQNYFWDGVDLRALVGFECGGAY
jgi:hypothetical protein